LWEVKFRWIRAGMSSLLFSVQRGWGHVEFSWKETLGVVFKRQKANNRNLCLWTAGVTSWSWAKGQTNPSSGFLVDAADPVPVFRNASMPQPFVQRGRCKLFPIHQAHRKFFWVLAQPK
jgi:hypothetical protein